MSTTATNSVKLGDLFSGLGEGMDTPLADLTVTDITTDSGRVIEGGLFLACQGFSHHGLEFVQPSIAAGAKAIVWEPAEGRSAPDLPEGVAGFAVTDLGNRVGTIADRFFVQPSDQARVTGVTGTNGKTTTAWLVSQALGFLGRKAGYMGTLGYGIGSSLKPSALTTPGVIAVHRRLRELVDAGATAVIMEVSSHGLDQGRLDAVRVRTAAFTNLSRDHLDYHADLAAYSEAKAKLFAMTSIENAVINVGDPFGAELVHNWHRDAQLIAVALNDRAPAGVAADLTADIVESNADGLLLQFAGRYGAAEMRSSLWGHFNAENLLVATGILLAHGYDLQQATAALENCESPSGRMQLVRAAASAPLVVVDFAHTEQALRACLGAAREHTGGQLWCVFGCGGDRDQGKRPRMGRAVEELADRVIVTDDNPRNEAPEKIAADILAGLRQPDKACVVHNRQAAIEYALSQAAADDLVVIAGKGHEQEQIIGNERRPFSDRHLVSRILQVDA